MMKSLACVKGGWSALQCINGECSYHVSLLGHLFCTEQSLCTDGHYELSAVDERQPLMRSKHKSLKLKTFTCATYMYVLYMHVGALHIRTSFGWSVTGFRECTSKI